ncbi:hypothetical protein [Candidatus Mycoplasma haematohominis]|uniref:hypothetical protein n=1 Tax=Candidatus Mycoplasma haematohominis TaxID=1494318 RepID=UPI001C0A6F34|nr:hypothetical protein [Candidatus Mycoplasma haemohominis]
MGGISKFPCPKWKSTKSSFSFISGNVIFKLGSSSSLRLFFSAASFFSSFLSLTKFSLALGVAFGVVGDWYETVVMPLPLGRGGVISIKTKSRWHKKNLKFIFWLKRWFYIKNRRFIKLFFWKK